LRIYIDWKSIVKEEFRRNDEALFFGQASPLPHGLPRRVQIDLGGRRDSVPQQTAPSCVQSGTTMVTNRTTEGTAAAVFQL
jgi:hypothetical protein